ncbi:hypothetical protein QBC35DRAFT_510736 [Podospora australis]|uniref:JmjC domain-containing protein n=1 Tax=Podospora australis TaxID=1536484 RepID=A0AAN6WKG1_9PEZI|nr:hypothetical protein QBC35DRAFT_510736 [Podospora australis]
MRWVLSLLCAARAFLETFCRHLSSAMDTEAFPSFVIDLLCHVHLRHLTRKMQVKSKPAAIRPRANSISDVTAHQAKRQRIEQPQTPSSAETRPFHNQVADENYRRDVVDELSGTPRTRASHGKSTNRLVLRLRRKIEQPKTDSRRGVAEVLFCTDTEAAALVQSQSPHDAPIITHDQQQFRWKLTARPIQQLFQPFARTMVLKDLHVSVQVPSRSTRSQSFEDKTLSEVRDRFVGTRSTDVNNPWNILDLQSPLPHCILPGFLAEENCQLLVQVKNKRLMANNAERARANPEEWNQWTNVLEWVLLRGDGFGWMSCPTEDERARWMASPSEYTGGRWRYVVLKEGQSIFFVPATIHFVFRKRQHQTFALGGHVLQWSGLLQWIQVVMNQIRFPNSTNENLDESVPGLVKAVRDIASTRAKEEGVEAVGGKLTFDQFLASTETILSKTAE